VFLGFHLAKASDLHLTETGTQNLDGEVLLERISDLQQTLGLIQVRLAGMDDIIRGVEDFQRSTFEGEFS